MNQEDNSIIPEKLILEINERFGLAPDMWNPMGGVENFVFEFVQNKKEYILRIGDNAYMEHNLVLAEIDWIQYLYDNDIPVAKPFKSQQGNLVEHITNGEKSYSVTIFEKIEGEVINFNEPLGWHQRLIENWGKLLGKMHSLSKEYTPQANRRYNFLLPDTLIDEMLPDEEKEVKDRIKQIHRQIASLPKDAKGYGLIHSDLHPGNFLVSENEIVGLFDFDRVCYKWFIADIAIALFYPLYQSPIRDNLENQKKFIDYFLPTLLKGYQEENLLSADWFSKIVDFVRLRDTVLYLYLPRESDFEIFRSDLKKRILNKHPILDYLDEFVKENLTN